MLKRATTNDHNVRQRPNIADIFMCVDLQCFVTAEVESRISSEETKFHDLLRSTSTDLKPVKRAHVRLDLETCTRTSNVRTHEGRVRIHVCACVCASVSMCGLV